jgi:hypothetical protein
MKTRGKKAEATEASREKKKVKAVGKATKIKEIKKIVNSIPKIDEPKKRIAQKSTKITKQIVKVASKSTTRKQNSENSTPLAISKSPSCVVVYTTGDYEYFRTEAMARKQRSGLPGSLVKEYRLFPSKQEATQFMDATFEDKKPASRKSEPKIVTPTKVGDPNANLPIKALNKIGLSRLESIKFPSNASYATSKFVGESNAVSSSYLASLKLSANSGLVEIRIHIFKYLFEPKPEYQIVTFELFDLKQGKTYWSHHGAKWEQIFQNAKVNGFGDMYDDVCYQFHSFILRNVTTSTSGLQNQPLVYEGIRSDGSRYQIEEQGLYLLLPFAYTVQQVKDEIAKFGFNALKSVAMEAYDIIHISQNSSLRQHLKPPSGNYWSMLQTAFAAEFTIIEETTLDNMFRDDDVFNFMGTLFKQFSHPRDYGNANLINFAYGRITAHDGLN